MSILSTATCEACDGRGWLIVDIDGDSSHAWVQRCDECQYFGDNDPRTRWDDDVAPEAAAYYSTSVAWARPNGGHQCDHTHAYLRSTPRLRRMLSTEQATR